MFGTVTLQVDSIIMWLMAIVAVAGLLFIIRKMEKRKTARYEADHAARQAKWEANELRHKRDHQLNHGRQIYNWLVKELEQHHKFGIRVLKIEDNGGRFSILIEDDEGPVPNIPILQLSYDFARYEAPYQGHIHYGAYGADILIWVGDHAPMNGLGQLVLEEVRGYVSRHPERLAKTIPAPAMMG